MTRRDLLTALLATLTASAGAGGWRRDNRELCARLDARLKEIEARRRAGYTAAQGRKLVEQKTKLAGQRRENCR